MGARVEAPECRDLMQRGLSGGTTSPVSLETCRDIPERELWEAEVFI
jgi:hypothetical protein